MNNIRCLYIVTARGGSKGVPGKNIKMLGGIPLLAYKIISAKRCKYKGRIIVSTDDKEIAETAGKWGGEVPFMRPDALASDEADSMDVVEHAVEWIETHDDSSYDYIVLLEPSSPFASYADFDSAIDKIIETNADTLLGMKEVEANTCFIHTLDEQGGLSLFYNEIKKMRDVRRQAAPPQYTMNGCIYIAKWDYFKKNKMFHSSCSVPYIMDGPHSIEIDCPEDYEYAKYLVEAGRIDISPWKQDKSS